MRMTDHHRRMSALQLKNAEDTIKRRLRGLKYKLFTRVACNIPVYTKGNEVSDGILVRRLRVEGLMWVTDSYGYR